MQKTDSNNKLNDFNEEIDLIEIFNVLYDGKWIILTMTTFVSLIGVIYSLMLPNIYESKALLVSVNTSSAISGTLQRYSGLAGIAGIDLPNSEDISNSAKAKSKIQSLSFFKSNILPNIQLQDLMAVKSWSPITKEIIYDKNIYDKKSNTWVRDYSYPKQQIPSAQESFKIFISKHLSISEDKNSGFITLSIKHQSPFIAKLWTDLVIDEVNAFYRKKDKTDSEKAVSYLKQQILKTSLSEIKLVIAELLQDETKKLMLIEANEFYVFDYIDPPDLMENKSEPKRSLICIISALLGGMLSIFVVLTKNYFFNKKSAKF